MNLAEYKNKFVDLYIEMQKDLGITGDMTVIIQGITTEGPITIKKINVSFETNL